MGLKLVTAPAVEALDLATAKAFLRVDGAADDTVIAALISASRSRYEGPASCLERAFITQTWEYTLDAFPVGTGSDGWLRLPLAPVQSIVSIGYTDGAGAAVVMDPDDYLASLASEPVLLYAAGGASWPTAGLVPGAVAVRFVAGYGDTADKVPADLVLAMLMNIACWYENRETVGKEFPGDAVAMGHRWAWAV